MADILNIGISGLKAHQTALAVTGNNIANADTEGYSRQRVSISNNNPQYSGGVWLGAGATVESVSRIYDQFLVGQFQKDTTTFNYFETLSSNAGQVDKLLADPSTGIQPGIENMFGAFQSAIDDPSSLPARQVVLSESQGLVDRFHSIQGQLNDSNNIVNGQLGVMATQITTLGESIAELNTQIQFATSSSNGNAPNDLLDRRDLAIKNLAELVSVSVVEQDGQLNVAIGNGQSLVIGNKFNTFTTQTGTNDPTRDDIVFTVNGVVQVITDQMEGGKIAGLLDYRSDVLDPVINQLGRVAVALQFNLNEQHALGIDIDGKAGGLFFDDINDPSIAQKRVVGNANNAQPNDRILGVYVTDPNTLTDSDYAVTFIGPNDYTFRVTRVSDGQEMLTSSLSTEFPESFDIEGFDLTFESGSYKQGDKFYLMPTRNGAKDIELDIGLPQEIALGSAVMTTNDIGNQGQAVISSGVVYDSSVSTFDVPGALSPPLVVKFTSDNRYDILDNTDPSNPVQLSPPIMQQVYVAGVNNNLLPSDEGKTAVTSLGGYLPADFFYQDYTAVNEIPGNGLFPARIRFSDPDPITGGSLKRSVISIGANTPAIEMVSILNSQKGISATARTTLELSDFVSDSNGFLEQNFYLNGIELTDTLITGQLKYDTGYPEVVPDPVDANFIADRINANINFQDMGIVARSDGGKVLITALNGDDLTIELQGDHGDSMSVSSGNKTYVKSTGTSLPEPLSKFEGYDFSEGGPYTYEFEVQGQDTFEIELKGTYNTGAELLTEIKNQISSTTFFFNGELSIDIDGKGNINFKTQIDISPKGTNGSAKLTMGGQVKVVLDEGITMESEPPLSNLFEEFPDQVPVYLGYELNMEGTPKEGDLFYVDFNSDAVTDNRNGTFLGNIQSKDIIEGDLAISEAYGLMVEGVGSITARAQISTESSQVLLQHSQNSVLGVSGVNLDEEAADLIRYELGYNASAQVISVARDLFSTLIGIFR
jgi:flagellar hook-associated protein 1 FlgK